MPSKQQSWHPPAANRRRISLGLASQDRRIVKGAPELEEGDVEDDRNQDQQQARCQIVVVHGIPPSRATAILDDTDATAA